MAASLPDFAKAGDPSEDPLGDAFPGGRPDFSTLSCPLGPEMGTVILVGNLPQISTLHLFLTPCLSHPSPRPASQPLGSWRQRVPALVLVLQAPISAHSPVSKPFGSGTICSLPGQGGEKHDPEAAQIQESSSLVRAGLHRGSITHVLSISVDLISFTCWHNLSGVREFWEAQIQPENPRTLNRRNPKGSFCL